jgi:hypothetical protein
MARSWRGHDAYMRQPKTAACYSYILPVAATRQYQHPLGCPAAAAVGVWCNKVCCAGHCLLGKRSQSAVTWLLQQRKQNSAPAQLLASFYGPLPAGLLRAHWLPAAAAELGAAAAVCPAAIAGGCYPQVSGLCRHRVQLQLPSTCMCQKWRIYTASPSEGGKAGCLLLHT